MKIYILNSFKLDIKNKFKTNSLRYYLIKLKIQIVGELETILTKIFIVKNL